jgi:hypothetical protein
MGKKNFFLVLVFLTLQFITPSTVGAKPKYGPDPNPRATPLSMSYDFFSEIQAPQFFALVSFYIPQMTSSSCSSASLAIILNAAKAQLKRTSEESNITELGLIKKFNIHNWEEKTLNKDGYHGEHGINISDFREIVELAFKQYGFPNATVELVKVGNTTTVLKNKIIEDLKSLSRQRFIIANFDQYIFTDDVHVGHFSPIAAYNEKKSSVLVLDTDREYFEPYWVSFDTFFSGVNTKYSSNNYRGYLLIDLKNSSNQEKQN